MLELLDAFPDRLDRTRVRSINKAIISETLEYLRATGYSDTSYELYRHYHPDSLEAALLYPNTAPIFIPRDQEPEELSTS